MAIMPISYKLFNLRVVKTLSKLKSHNDQLSKTPYIEIWSFEVKFDTGQLRQALF